MTGDNVKIEISIHRGDAATLITYNSEFLKRLEAFAKKEADENPDMGLKDSAYYDFREGYKSLVRAVERILPQETEQPFQIVLDVQGEEIRRSGAVNY